MGMVLIDAGSNLQYQSSNTDQSQQIADLTAQVTELTFALERQASTQVRE
jgi:hypothetical protein